MGRAAVAIMLAGALVGCAATEEEPVAQTPSGSVRQAPPDPTPEESPTEEGPVDRSDAEVGIVFTDLPDVTGEDRAALDVYTLFELEFWRAMTTGEVASVLELITSPEVLSIVRAQVDGNNERGWDVAGTVTVQVSEVIGDENLVIVDSCQDMDATFTSAERTLTAQEAGFATAVIRVELARGGGGQWAVQSYAEVGEC